MRSLGCFAAAAVAGVLAVLGGAFAAAAAIAVFAAAAIGAARAGRTGWAAAMAPLAVAAVAAVVQGPAPGLGWALAAVLAATAAAMGAQLASTVRRARSDVDSLLVGYSCTDPVAWLLRTLGDLYGATREQLVWAEQAGGRPDAGLIAEALLTGRVARRRSLVAVPLGDEQAVVVLGGVRRGGRFLAATAESVGRIAASQLRDARARERLRSPDLRDPLTGLGNTSAALLALADASERDLVMAVGFTEPATLQDREGPDRVALLTCQLGLHLEHRTREHDVLARIGDDGTHLLVLRAAAHLPQQLVGRVLDSWVPAVPGAELACAVVVRDPGTPAVDELERARGGLRALQDRIDLPALEASGGKAQVAVPERR